ncbi:MAG: ribosome small subunit-dependent GTPase A [Bacteroidales bacterium]|nr:ribosome small subunit-dependent GTPase A [Bacteroidales bacterium]MDD3666775.1 ribosome small subunit-dependent GTPase A [Bacteroidales bacterium]
MEESTRSGLLIKSTGKWYLVRMEDGSILRCGLAGKFRTQGLRSTNPVAVGDRVCIKPGRDNATPGTIVAIGERKNHIVRKATRLSSSHHVIASNIDQALLVITPSQPRTSTGFIDRFLISANAFDIPVILIFNKSDIYTPDETLFVQHLMRLYSQMGYSSLVTSTINHTGLDELKTLMTGKISVMAGHSGAGKSALINALEPSLKLQTGSISQYHLKGKHTTTFAEMHPLSFGGFITDTPGIKEFGISSIEKNEIASYFPEFFNLLQNCRFYNCQHLHEPGCAVKQAVEQGEIAESRYMSYLSMMSGEEFDED